MVTIEIEGLKPGMILGEDIRDGNGRLILGKGLPVREKHLRIFRIWGVNRVRIQDSHAGSLQTVFQMDPLSL